MQGAGARAPFRLGIGSCFSGNVCVGVRVLLILVDKRARPSDHPTGEHR